MPSSTQVDGVQPNLAATDMTRPFTCNDYEVASSADYWTDLLRNNLQVANSLQDADSYAEGYERVRISEETMNAPRRYIARDALAQEIAARLYPGHDPDSLAPTIRYEKDVILLRSLVLDQRRSTKDQAIRRNARHNWIKRIAAQGPWNEAEDPLSVDGAPSLPMPVEVSTKEPLAPFFAHLRNGGTHETSSNAAYSKSKGTAGVEPYYDVELLEFEKGAIYADGRVDLCK